MNSKTTKANEYHAKGQELSEKGLNSEAIEAYKSAIQYDPNKSESFYNIGLIYKYQLLWSESFEYNSIANKLALNDESARWNLAIAATALRNWAVARQCWIENGIKMDPGNDPIEMNFGITPVRLNPEDSGEVVWATRIDPVRARIENIPNIESGFNQGDIVLHDGAALGYRKLGDTNYPVFNVLCLFEKSSNKTVVYEIHEPNKKFLDSIENICINMGIRIENWSENIRALCRQCSEGITHAEHDSDLNIPANANHLVAFSSGDKSQIHNLIQSELLKFNLSGELISENE